MLQQLYAELEGFKALTSRSPAAWPALGGLRGGAAAPSARTDSLAAAAEGGAGPSATGTASPWHDARSRPASSAYSARSCYMEPQPGSGTARSLMTLHPKGSGSVVSVSRDVPPSPAPLGPMEDLLLWQQAAVAAQEPSYQEARAAVSSVSAGAEVARSERDVAAHSPRQKAAEAPWPASVQASMPVPAPSVTPAASQTDSFLPLGGLLQGGVAGAPDEGGRPVGGGSDGWSSAPDEAAQLRTGLEPEEEPRRRVPAHVLGHILRCSGAAGRRAGAPAGVAVSGTVQRSATLAGGPPVKGPTRAKDSETSQRAPVLSSGGSAAGLLRRDSGHAQRPGLGPSQVAPQVGNRSSRQASLAGQSTMLDTAARSQVAELLASETAASDRSGSRALMVAAASDLAQATSLRALRQTMRASASGASSPGGGHALMRLLGQAAGEARALGQRLGPASCR